MEATYTRIALLTRELEEAQREIASKLEGEDLITTMRKEGRILVCIEEELDNIAEKAK